MGLDIKHASNATVILQLVVFASHASIGSDLTTSSSKTTGKYNQKTKAASTKKRSLSCMNLA